MDARERLREYLEQRRELGESEFVLDGLSVDDALNALGVRGGAPNSQSPSESPRDVRSTGPMKAVSADWREALRSVGVDKPEDAGRKSEAAPPPEKLGRYEMPKPKEPAVSATGELKQGIVIGDASAASANGLGHLGSLDDIAKSVAACTLCDLHASALHPVPGSGNPAAKFVCVGEAPGAKEDESGLPFVGQSGELLTKILEAIGFKREDVFICNVLKHRPPANRNPSPDEVAVCSPYLLRQLELLQPRVILALGTFAAQTLLQTAIPIGKLRGQVHRYYGVPLIVTYHPAALLRNPSWKRPTWEDVQLARRIFDNAASSA